MPASFGRKDLEKLEETKEAMRRDSEKYAEEHAHDDDKPETIDDLMKEETVDAGESGDKVNEKKDGKKTADNAGNAGNEGKDEK